MSILQSGATKSLAASYDIDNSLRFDDDVGYLRKTFASAGDQESWTYSCWVKRATLDNQFQMFATDYSDTDNYMNFKLRASSGTAALSYICEIVWKVSGTTRVMRTSQVFRDCGAWMHIVVVCDTPDATDTNRLRLYVNGEEVTAFSTDERSGIGQNDDLPINRAGVHDIGGWNGSGDASGYLAEVYFIDGTALEPDSFGETSSTTNQWIPLDSDDVKDAVTFGTNGFYQKYGATELADDFADVSGNAPLFASFTSTGASTWTCPAGVTSIELLVVAGGGGGGGFQGGGGGAGGVIYDTDYTVVPGTVYDITVGAGGAAGSGAGSRGTTGSDSVWNVNAEGSGITFTSDGGGGGGSEGANDPYDGGSGGGSGSYNTNNGQATQASPSGATGYGYDGGTGYNDGNLGAGGGGGAGAVGANGTVSVGGDGGAGREFSTFSSYGVSGFFAGGGGGGTYLSGSGGSGGSGGGGAGSSGSGTAATANTGGGGGGSGGTGGVGGSGVVLIKYSGNHTITANGDVTNTRAVRKIGDSSIIFDGTNDYLQISDGLTDFDFGTDDVCIEFWINTTQTSTCRVITRGDHPKQWFFRSNTSVASECIKTNIGGSVVSFDGSGGTEYIATGSWHHLALVRQSTALRYYIDGVQRFSNTSISGSWDVGTPETDTLAIGQGITSGEDEDFDGYLDEIRISVGAARYPDGTTFTPLTTAFTADSYTKLLIHSNWDGGLGADSSGNYNTFTATNLVATDQMVDTPTNNFATLNPLANVDAGTASVVSEGNLKIVFDSSGMQLTPGTIGVSSGKWYWEGYVVSKTGDTSYFGVMNSSSPVDVNIENIDPGCAYKTDGNKQLNGASSSYGDSYTTGDIIGLALNLDDNEVIFYKNNTAQNSGTAISITADTYVSVIGRGGSTSTWVYNFGSDSSFAGNKTAQGNQDSNSKGDFYYEPPTDYLALCTSNLPSPEIADPTAHFNTVLWAGDDADPRTISGLNFQPDAIWVKARSGTYGAQDHCLNDAVRGAGEILRPNRDYAEATDTNNIESFTSDGWTMGDDEKTNKGSTSYVGWSWKGGGAAVSNTDGTITSSVSANTTAGFSIAAYTGTGSAATIGHGLSSAPEMVIVKNLDQADAFQVGSSKGIDFTDYLVLDTNAAAVDNVDRWNDTTPSASVFTIGDGVEVNTNTEDYIAYCFHSVEGYSKVGSYEGNGNLDGTFVYTGFRPAFVMTKSRDSTSGWQMFDNKREGYNVDNYELLADLSAVEDTSTEFIDIVSNGFKNRDTTDPNVAETYIYIAFAESPFKYSNAR